jgi:hypothetical protein
MVKADVVAQDDPDHLYEVDTLDVEIPPKARALEVVPIPPKPYRTAVNVVVVAQDDPDHLSCVLTAEPVFPPKARASEVVPHPARLDLA